MQFPGGFLHGNGEALERVETKHGVIELLAAGDGTELIRHRLRKGARFGVRPEEGWEAAEFIMVMSGAFRLQIEEQTRTLVPGDHLAFAPVVTPCILEAIEESSLLYISSRPVFQYYSADVQKFLALAVAVEEKDGYTKEHCQRIQEFAVAVGRELSLSTQSLHRLLYGAFLHDVGKVGIPDEILGKTEKLTDAEWEIMKRHPVIGQEMLAASYLREAGVVVAQHHERFDGSGYPLGLSGEEIALEAQIVAVVDSYDAMTTDRPYHQAITHAEALTELKRCAGTLFNPKVVEAFINVIDRSNGTHIGLIC